MIIRLSSKFVKNYRKLSNEIKKQAKDKEIVFRENPFDIRLRTHKLVGKEKECWAFSINYSYRIKFIFVTKREAIFLDIGPHSIYK